MARRKLENKNIRKLTSISRSIAVTLPIGFIRELKWRRKQKVVIKLKGKKITIEDWKK